MIKYNQNKGVTFISNAFFLSLFINNEKFKTTFLAITFKQSIFALAIQYKLQDI